MKRVILIAVLSLLVVILGAIVWQHKQERTQLLYLEQSREELLELENEQIQLIEIADEMLVEIEIENMQKLAELDSLDSLITSKQAAVQDMQHYVNKLEADNYSVVQQSEIYLQEKNDYANRYDENAAIIEQLKRDKECLIQDFGKIYEELEIKYKKLQALYDGVGFSVVDTVYVIDTIVIPKDQIRVLKLKKDYNEDSYNSEN